MRNPILNIHGYIYITTNHINNRQYIGQHTYSKPELDETYFGSGKALLKAIEKYGKENFSVEILDWAQNKTELDELEKYYIALFNAVENDMFYNILHGGEGLGAGEHHPSYGKPHNGDLHGKNNPMYGRHHTEETKELIRKNRTNVKLSPKHKQKLIQSNIGNKKKAKKVYQYTLEGKYVRSYLSTAETVKYGFNDVCICYCCLGKQKQHKGFLWSRKPPNEFALPDTP